MDKFIIFVLICLSVIFIYYGVNYTEHKLRTKWFSRDRKAIPELKQIKSNYLYTPIKYRDITSTSMDLERVYKKYRLYTLF